MEIRVGGKYKVCKKLGSGSYGDIYMGMNMKTNEEVGIKLEKIDADTPMLIYEARIYDKFKNTAGFPEIYWSGVEGEYSVMVMEILGPSLNALFEFCDCKFEVKTIFWMAI